MKTYQTIGSRSDVSVLDTEQFGDSGVEITTREGRSWSCLTVSAAIEQLEILRDQYGLMVPDQCIADLEAESADQSMFEEMPLDRFPPMNWDDSAMVEMGMF